MEAYRNMKDLLPAMEFVEHKKGNHSKNFINPSDNDEKEAFDSL